MKKLLTILAVLGLLGAAVPAHAGHPKRRIVSYVNGMPVYAVYQMVGYSRMGVPIFQWVTQPVGPPGHFKQWRHDNGNHYGWYHHRR